MAFVSYYNPVLHGSLAPAADADFVKSLLGFLQSSSVKFRNWRLRLATRRQLRRLPENLLKDIGITRYEVETSNFNL